MVTGSSLDPTTEKDCPVRLSGAIWTGAELPFNRETGVLAVWPSGTVPKVTALGDALSAPVLAWFTRVAPQPARARGRQLDKIRSRTVLQLLRQRD
jgi:hypothetical protein